MRYPHFNAARVIMASNGWVKDNGSNRFMEISEKGLRWLEEFDEVANEPSVVLQDSIAL
ncbi:MAG: hypothetical protein NTW21_41365 [Verrucomicrobia bacterium]|nr:hypothetical protein [Verrucomicrobiota bacterium]